jgi:hypothetical protein
MVPDNSPLPHTPPVIKKVMKYENYEIKNM